MANDPANIKSGITEYALVKGIRHKLTITPQANIFATSIFVLSLISPPCPCRNQNKI
jgi:hypothetical protein